MASISIGRAGERGLHAALLDSMFRLRCEVFHDRLDWAVRVEDGRERDWFDSIGPYYLIAHENDVDAIGCCRLLPTTGPNMLRDVFACLLDGAPTPTADDIWEVSRFALRENNSSHGFGFSEVPTSILSEMIRFSASHGVRDLVGVTSAPVERMLKRMGLLVERLGRAQRIGDVMSLAFRIPVDAYNLDVANAALVATMPSRTASDLERAA
jgi:acyl homoserine lactone synthase